MPNARPLRARLMAGLLLAATAACTRPPPSPDALATEVTHLADSIFAATLEFTPEFGTRSGISGVSHARIASNAPADLRAAEQRWDALRTRVRAIDPAPLFGRPEWALYTVMSQQLEAEQAMRVCRLELWTVASYVNGWQARFTDLAILQPVGSDSLRAEALARARAIPAWLDQEIANLREGQRLGYSSPKVIVRNVIRQVDDLVSTPTRESPFYSPALRDSSVAFADSLAAVVEMGIVPAMQRYRAYLAGEYLPVAREALGVSNNPDGAACYAATIRHFATVEMPADSVYAMGLAQMALIEEEMRTISERSFGGESIETLLPRLNADPRYAYRTSQEIIDTSAAVIARARAAMPQWFGRQPKAEVIIQPYPEFRQRAGAPGQYQAAPEDGSRPAIFLINPSNPTRQSRARTESTALHEGIPGHHLQIGIAAERTDAHPIMRYTFTSGFGEGWALYAERLGDEMGVYSSDLARIGMLGSEAFRAARMVIDAGLHMKGWSREQSHTYMRSRSFLADNVLDGEIDRYISWPGQAPSYMIGRTEILRLREEARARLGERFDIRTFHDRVLENGTVPLWALRRVVEGWEP